MGGYSDDSDDGSSSDSSAKRGSRRPSDAAHESRDSSPGGGGSKQPDPLHSLRRLLHNPHALYVKKAFNLTIDYGRFGWRGVPATELKKLNEAVPVKLKRVSFKWPQNTNERLSVKKVKCHTIMKSTQRVVDEVAQFMEDQVFVFSFVDGAQCVDRLHSQQAGVTTLFCSCVVVYVLQRLTAQHQFRLDPADFPMRLWLVVDTPVQDSIFERTSATAVLKRELPISECCCCSQHALRAPKRGGATFCVFSLL